MGELTEAQTIVMVHGSVMQLGHPRPNLRARVPPGELFSGTTDCVRHGARSLWGHYWAPLRCILGEG